MLKLNKEKRLMLAIFSLFTILSIAVSAYIYKSKKNENLASAEKMLETISELKINQINDWRGDCSKLAELVSSRTLFVQTLNNYMKNKTRSGDYDILVNSLDVVKTTYDLLNVSTADTNGRILITSNSNELYECEPRMQFYIPEVVRSKKTIFGDFFYCTHRNKVLLEVYAPIIIRNTQEVIGVDILTIDPGKYLYPLIQEWPVPSKTSETLLIEQEGDSIVFLNELRHKKDTALKLKIPLSRQSLPAAAAVKGNEGAFQGIDYRGIDVLAYTSQIPNSNWCMVAKTDLSEVHEPMKLFIMNLGIVVIIVIAFAGSILAFIYSMQRRRHFQEMYEKELDKAAAETKYKSIFENIPVGFARHEIILNDKGDPCDYRFLEINPAFEKQTGLKVEFAKGKTVKEILPGIEQHWIDTYGKVALTGEPIVFENYNKDLDKYFQVNAYSPAKGYFTAIFADITLRKKAEEALRQSEEKFRAIFENNSSAIAIIEPDTTISMVNDAYCQISGYSREEVVGMSWTKQIPPGDLERLKEYNRQRLLNPKEAPDKYEFTFYHRTGPIRHALMSVSLVQSINKIIASFVDITERKKTEKALYTLSERQQALLDSVPDIIMEVDSNKVYTWGNKPGLEFFGEDALGKEASYYFEGEQQTYQIVQPLFNGLSGDIIYVESWQRRKDGEKRLLAWWCKMLKDELGHVTGALSTARDITDSKKAEEALRESEEKFRLAFNTTPDAISITRASDGLLMDVNPGFCEMAGYSREELKDKSSLELNLYANPEDRRKIVETLREEGMVINYEAKFRRKDGTFFAGLMSAAIMSVENVPCILSITRNIDEIRRAQAEREKFTRELEHINKELETLVFIASHDLRSPLINVIGFSKMLEKEINSLADKIKTGDFPENFKYEIENTLTVKFASPLNYINASALKMDALINGLLKLSRSGRIPLNLREIDMNELMRNVIDSAAFQISNAGAELIADNLPPCAGDYNQVLQVMSNILDNALKYKAPERKSVIRIYGETDGNKSRYIIEDNGIGIEQKNLEKVFNLFTRVDSDSKVEGEGVGLALARRIIERQRGKIYAESELGKGSRFIIELPSAL